MEPDNLNTFMQQMLTRAQNSAQWASDQAPIVAEELLRWQAIDNAARALVLAVAAYYLWRAGSHLIEESGYDTDARIAGWAVRIIGCVVFASSLSCALAVLEVFVAPRLAVLRYVASMIQ